MLNAERREERGLGRRQLLGLGLGAFVVAAVPLAVRRRRELVRRTVPVMGTIAHLAVDARDPRHAHAAIDDAVDALRLVEATMTRFSDTSEVGRVNLMAATRPVAVGAATAAVVAEGLAWAHASEGAFDPCLGRAIRLWDVGHRRTPPPSPQVQSLADRRLYRAVELDRWRGSPVVRFTDPDAQLDLGGIAKGYGVDRAVDALRRRGITRALVTVGGDLYALGEAEDGEAWRIGVRSPADPERIVDELEIREAAVATSGDYFRYFRHGGRRYHHLLDPVTGAPRLTAVRSVTVTAGTCMAADTGATAVYGMAPARAEQLLTSRAPGARVARVIAGEA